MKKLWNKIKNLFKHKTKTKTQYTKLVVTALTIMACIWITTSYVFAGYSLIVYGITEPLSELSQQVCITILGVVIAYCTKAYWENYSEAKMNLLSQGVIIDKKDNNNSQPCG